MQARLTFGVAALVLLSWLVAPSRVTAQVKVFVDFTSDVHNGAGGAGGDGADWIEELNKATTTVPDFDSTERAVIEADILTQLTTIYAGYDITFSLTAPSSPYDVIAMGKDNTGFGSLGIALTDQGNTISGQVAEVATGNFTSTLDEFSGMTDRATQMAQIATSLAGTAAHELGHTLGLSHHDAYSHPSVVPATYGSTAGVQNTHTMATDDTGLDEPGREVTRSMSRWSKAKLDVAGGAIGAIAGDHQKLVATPIPLDTSEESPGIDAGPMIASAKPIAMSTGSSSGMLLGFVSGNPDDTNGAPPPDHTADVDTWRIGIPGPGFITAEIFGTNRFGSFGYNTALELLDSSGSLIYSNDNVLYDGDTYNTGTLRQTDPLLLNIPVFAPGFYYIRITNPVPIEVGTSDAYWLLAGFAPVPEPVALSVLPPALLLLQRRRRS